MIITALVVQQLEYDGYLRVFEMQAIPDRSFVVAPADEFNEPHEGPFHFLDRRSQKEFTEGFAERRALKLSESQFALENGEYRLQIAWYGIPTQRNSLSCYALSLPEFAVPTMVRLKDPHSDREYAKTVIRDDQRNRFNVYLECRSSVGLFDVEAEITFKSDQDKFSGAKYSDRLTGKQGVRAASPLELIPEDVRPAVQQFLSVSGAASQAAPIPPSTSVSSNRTVTRKLPPKTSDLSEYFDQAKLTDKQREAISLKFEYDLPVAEIARRLGIGRKTVDEHIEAAKKKIDVARHRQKKRPTDF